MRRGDATNALVGTAEALSLTRDGFGPRRAATQVAETASHFASFQRIAPTVRRQIVTMTAKAESGHPRRI